MTVSEIAELLKPYGSPEYSFYEYLNATDYGSTLMADTPLPKAVKSLCACTAVDVGTVDFLFPDKLNEDIAARFGDLRDRAQEAISPIDTVNPTAPSRHPGICLRCPPQESEHPALRGSRIFAGR